MKQFLEFLPLILFFAVFQLDGKTLELGNLSYQVDGIYSATWALIAATALQVLLLKTIWGSVERRLLWVSGLVVVFGGATILLRDPLFIIWKPTILNFGLCLACVGWHWYRGHSFFADLVPGDLEIPPSTHKWLTGLSAFHFTLVGTLNIIVAYTYSLDTWVSYKFYSAFAFTVLWAVMITVLLYPYLRDLDAGETGEKQ